ncbi:hypothetical protein [Microcoleus sp. D2_18a_D3]|uniref:hypothetical protein n=1 Tax=Microcoleus sp. D2_18a_D3 TaxID=3055330 RepID=UPI002FD2EC63
MSDVLTPTPFPPAQLSLLTGGSEYCTVIVAKEFKRWLTYVGGYTEYIHWTSTGNVTRYEQDGRGYLKIRGQYQFIDPPGEVVSYPEFIPDWREGTLVDYFDYGAISGAGGFEKDLYSYIKNQFNYYYDDGFQRVATSYKLIYSNCPNSSTSPNVPPSAPTLIYFGTAAPPPPPPKDMPCCDCNVIATIMAENTITELKQHEATREHIDRRTIEGLREINKMLQGMNFNMNLQPIIDRLNELEANLWNGLRAGG